MKQPTPKKWIWWKHGTVYHIYPRSFYDSNSDGIGDIKGIIQKLDYLKKLGIDAIWLSPVYESPQVDFGYDVSDYLRIDSIFGDLNDFKELLKQAHKRSIKVILDMIMNHTSDQHPWFLASSNSVDNPKRNWYIWHDGKDGKVPNNWKTSFGKSAWDYSKKTGQYYYHSFFSDQPDLNWRNVEVKKAFFDIFRYWLNLGVDGFRLDVVNMIIKDKKFRDNPSFLKMFSVKSKFYTRNRPRSIKTLKEFRKLLNEYKQRMCVGEIYTLPPGNAEVAAKYLGSGNNSLHLAFDFSLIFKPWNAKIYAQTIKNWYEIIPVKGWPCNVLSNHDLLRNYNRNKWRLYKEKKGIVSAFLLLTLKGTPFIYYGEEIGMQNAYIPRKYIKDPLGKLFWPLFSGRDKARSPMQWSSNKYAGFSNIKPWLPIHRKYKKVNVELQDDNEKSLLWYYQKLLKLRKAYSALYAGNWEQIDDGKNGVFSYKRFYKTQIIIVILNFKAVKKMINASNYIGAEVLLSTHRAKKSENEKLKLYPLEASILLISELN